jgi:Protein of unknown function (DUF3515)
MARSPGRVATLVAVPAALLAGVVMFWLLGGFPAGSGSPAPSAASSPAAPASGPVSVSPPALDEHAATVCRALVSKLPVSLGDRARRPVTAGAEQAAAYGEPPIVLSCGGAQPQVPQDAQLLGLSGVCWFAEEQAGGQTWSTVYRTVPVRVTVPKAYDQPGQWVVDFSAPIVDAVPLAAGVNADASQVCAAPSPR